MPNFPVSESIPETEARKTIPWRFISQTNAVKWECKTTYNRLCNWFWWSSSPVRKQESCVSGNIDWKRIWSTSICNRNLKMNQIRILCMEEYIIWDTTKSKTEALISHLVFAIYTCPAAFQAYQFSIFQFSCPDISWEQNCIYFPRLNH